MGALFGDSSACRFAFSVNFLKSDAIYFEVVARVFLAASSYIKMNDFVKVKSCLIVQASSTRQRHSSPFEKGFKQCVREKSSAHLSILFVYSDRNSL